MYGLFENGNGQNCAYYTGDFMVVTFQAVCCSRE